MVPESLKKKKKNVDSDDIVAWIQRDATIIEKKKTINQSINKQTTKQINP